MKKRRLQFLLLSVTILIAFSCSSRQKFDSDKWKHKRGDWWMTDVRENMVDDLITSDTLIGMSQDQVITLLGKPENGKDKAVHYLIREKYGSNIDPEYISNLIIQFRDGQVIKYKIEQR